nr:Tn3 family transposase [Ensifer adhaerens]
MSDASIAPSSCQHPRSRAVLQSSRRTAGQDIRKPVLSRSGLNLLINAVVYWNTLYLEPAFAELNREEIATPPDVIKHITPLGWQHIGLTGDYIWIPTDGLDFRPLRRKTSIFAA